MKIGITTSVYCLVAVCCFGCRREAASVDAEATTHQTVELTVESLIEQLVSPVPAKYPTGEWERLTVTNSMENGFIHPQVAKARTQLVDLGTEIYPTLAEHINDDRYSYSGIYAAWVNHSVGRMLADIMADGIELNVGIYKSRENPSGSNGPPSFGEMVRESGGFEKYAVQAKGRSKMELRKEYLHWHIAKERSYGFLDDKQEKQVLGAYLKLLEAN